MYITRARAYLDTLDGGCRGLGDRLYIAVQISALSNTRKCEIHTAETPPIMKSTRFRHASQSLYASSAAIGSLTGKILGGLGPLNDIGHFFS
jgi:hypothetical protein